jgi:hypothetical protein
VRPSWWYFASFVPPELAVGRTPLRHCWEIRFRTKLPGSVHLFALCFFHLPSFADECFPFNLSRTLFHPLVGFTIVSILAWKREYNIQIDCFCSLPHMLTEGPFGFYWYIYTRTLVHNPRVIEQMNVKHKTFFIKTFFIK